MKKNLFKIILSAAGLILVTVSFLVLLNYSTYTAPLNVTSDVIQTGGSSGGGAKIKFKNPAQSTDFSDLGSSVYTTNDQLQGGSAGFSVTYFSSDQSFAIDISKQPLVEYRKKASEYLLQTLQITEAEACQLKVYIGVSHVVSPTLSGKNLGLSFCPNAIDLSGV